MLEIGTAYSKPQLSQWFATKDMEGLKRKMRGYGITFQCSGRGERAVFQIMGMTDPFKVFAVLDLGVDARTDFKKLRMFYYHYFNDETFMAMPDEVKEVWMKRMGHPVSRQTIASYTQKLERNDLINRQTDNFLYYFAHDHEQRIVEKSEYLEAWHDYWEDVELGLGYGFGIHRMILNYGGVARKQAIPDINGIYNGKIEQMLTFIQQSMDYEAEGGND